MTNQGQYGPLATHISNDESSKGLGSLNPVDADTANNDINKSSSNYSAFVAESQLRKFSYVDCYGCCHIYLSIAKVKRVKLSNSLEDEDELVPDSGATAHMLQLLMYFCRDYTWCSNSFVVMADRF